MAIDAFVSLLPACRFRSFLSNPSLLDTRDEIPDARPDSLTSVRVQFHRYLAPDEATNILSLRQPDEIDDPLTSILARRCAAASRAAVNETFLPRIDHGGRSAQSGVTVLRRA
jgi:hypothetical protein